MMGKACRVLQSNGIAPNNETTWKLLKAKHPRGPVPLLPATHSAPVTLEQDVNILSILHSFPKDTAAGPSGLRVQHLLDVASIPLPTPICSLLLQVVNILISGKAPLSIVFFAGARLIALNKIKEGCPPDVRPIAVGETLRRLTGKCVCAILKEKVADFFHPLQYGVACQAGAEKVDMKNAFNQSQDSLSLKNVPLSTQSCIPLAVETFGNWGREAQCVFSRLATLLALRQGRPKSSVVRDIYGCLSISLVHCPYCPDHQLDPLGHHAMMCKWGGDVVVRHNALRDVFAQFCHRAQLGGQLEEGHGSGSDSSHSRPADILVPNWLSGKPAAFDLTVVSPLNSKTLNEAGATGGSAAGNAKARKHMANDQKCRELGWVCVPLAVETYGCWGEEAQCSVSRLAAGLALQLQCSKSKAITNIYQRLNLTLVRCNARALLSWSRLQHAEDMGKPAAFDITVTSPLNPISLPDAKVTGGSAARMAEMCKHISNDPKCRALGWVCIPLAVETYGCWGTETRDSFSRLAARLALQLHCSKSKALVSIYPTTQPHFGSLRSQGLTFTCRHPDPRAMLRDASTSAGSAAYAAECRKHEANDTKCQELGWTCIPLAVETFGHWGKEAQAVFSHLASFIAIHQASPKSSVLNEIYSRLNMSLVRSVARAILVRGSAA
ncbi:hypothetical protein EMCRGX_G032714 [Ephydatia muelleri]